MFRLIALTAVLMSLSQSLVSPATAQRARGARRAPRRAAQRAPRRAAMPNPAANDAPHVFFSAGGRWDWFVVESVDTTETLGRAAAFSIQGTATEVQDPASLIGLRAVIGVRGPNGTYNLRHGFVDWASYSPQEFDDQRQFRYDIRVVTWLGLLRQTATCEIFEGLSIPQMVSRVFGRYPFSDVEFRLSHRYPRHEREVQYRETDLNFVQRNLEQEGMYFFVEHSSTGHKLIITDAEARPHGNLRLVTTGDGPNSVAGFQRQAHLRPNSYVLADVAADGTPLHGSATEPNPTALDFTMFDYPGEFTSARDVNRLSALRLDELRSNAMSVSGRVTNPAIHIGHEIWIDGHSFLVTSLSRTDIRSNDSMIRFEAVPRSQRFRPRRVAPKPIIQGVQTATVLAVGSGNNRRIRVRFPWERERAGGTLGTWVAAPASEAPIAEGTRVLMAFDEGDPNRPIAVQTLGPSATTR